MIKVIDDLDNGRFVVQELTPEEYRRATDKEATQFMRAMGGIEENTIYGRKATHPNSKVVVYLGTLNKMPKHIQKKVAEYKEQEN